MRRIRSQPRKNWQKIIAEQGLIYDTPARDGRGSPRPYWDESVCYEFSLDQILGLESTVSLLHSMCLEAVDYVINTERFTDFGLPQWSWQAIAESWRRSDPYIYGRFDLHYDGGLAKLLEYNADTPTSLLEASIVQWSWLEQTVGTDSRYDQWNSIHEKLVERWRYARDYLPAGDLHFTWSAAEPTGEDHVTVAYMQQTAAEAGHYTVGLPIEEIGWDEDLQTFVDLEEVPITAVFKLYPWEFALDDAFGHKIIDTLSQTMWVEPLWKTLLSNKALLAILWKCIQVILIYCLLIWIIQGHCLTM